MSSHPEQLGVDRIEIPMGRSALLAMNGYEPVIDDPLSQLSIRHERDKYTGLIVLPYLLSDSDGFSLQFTVSGRATGNLFEITTVEEQNQAGRPISVLRGIRLVKEDGLSIRVSNKSEDGQAIVDIPEHMKHNAFIL